MVPTINPLLLSGAARRGTIAWPPRYYLREPKETSHAITRRTVLRATTAALAAPLLPRFAKAAEYSWKFAHTAPTTFPLHIRLAEAAAQIGKESNGRMELQIFPDGQLGGDNDLLSQARSGAIEFCQPTGQILATILPVTAINALGFAWSGYDKLWPAMDGDLGKYVRTQIAAKTGLVAMDRMWDLGFRNITTSTKPIRNADDLVGLKIRTPVAPSLVTLFKTLKAAPLALQFTELYSALQTHIADAAGKPADADQGDQTVRGAEVLLHHQSRLGRPLVRLQRCCPGRGCRTN